MRTLKDHLAHCSHHTLRGIATRFHLRHYQENRKADWINTLVSRWLQPTTQQIWLASLSDAAQSALWRLIQAEQIPAVLFWAEYGPVRQVSARQKWSPPPWQEPATVSEELYYSALLCSLDGATLSRAHLVATPADLRSALAAQLATGLDNGDHADNAARVIPVDETIDNGWVLCHDVGQLLIYLHAQPAFKLLHGRWLSRAHLKQLATRLLTPVTVQASHRRSPYLRLLMALVTLGELQDQGIITPKGWQWLADEPVAQLTWLWNCWQSMAPDDRARYALPGAGIAPPWPKPLLRQLKTFVTTPAAPFTASDLVHGMWRANEESPAFWAANFHHIQDLDEIVEATLAEVLQPFAVVVPSAVVNHTIAEHDRAPTLMTYTLTETGQALLQGNPLVFRHRGVLVPAQLMADAAHDRLPIDCAALPSPGSLNAQAQFAAYGNYATPPTRSISTYHRYTFTPATIARAAAAGLGIPTFLQALRALAIDLTPLQQQQVATWHAQGEQLSLTYTPLLRTTTTAQLATILQEPTLRHMVGDVLSPVTAVITTDLSTFAHQLQAAGYYAASPPIEPATNLTGQATNSAAVGTLWLTGQIYAHLGEHLPLPLPPPFAQLDALFQQLAPAQQAVLHAQLTELHERLLDLVDQLPFTPPPMPTDPEEWHPIIDQAINEQRKLTMTYFSAGRNLTTQRIIDPYWIEERRGIPYLRAYCHNAGRVLTFRLDRIDALSLHL